MSDLDKLVPALRHALEIWQTQSAGSPALQHRRITVSVTYTGNVADLERVGLDTGCNSNGEVTGQIEFRNLERLVLVPGVVRVTMQPTSRPLLDETVAEMRVPWKKPPGFMGKGAGVIIAIIDTGIDIFHESFRTTSGTRILELWDQSATTGGSAPPAGFPQIGRVYTAAHINAGISAGPPFASIDSNGHGTHVAGIAAGNGAQDDRCSFPGHYIGVAPLADLVVVKAIALPAGSSEDTRAALRWCAQASARHGGKPVVINCSWGSDLGAHDGNDYDDISVDRILRPSGTPIPTGLAVVVAAGNEGNGTTHDSGTLQPAGQVGASTTVSFDMPNNSTDADPLSLWYDGSASITVQLIAPASAAFPSTNTTGPFAAGGAGSPFTIGRMQIFITSPASGDPTHGNRKNVSISISTTPPQWQASMAYALQAAVVPQATPTGYQYECVTAGRSAPTEPTWPKTLGATVTDGTTVWKCVALLNIRPGVWQLILTNTSPVAANWDIWLQSSHGDGYPSFHLPTEKGAPPPRRRNNTISSPGMSRNAITVANYLNNNITRSSSRGPATSPPGTPSGELKPTLAAVGAGVTAARSRNDKHVPSSCCDQQVVDKMGTSMAAPHVAGLVALMFEKNHTLTFEQVRGHLQHSARLDGIPTAETPVVIDPVSGIRWGHIWGAGKVDAQVALNEVPPAARLGGGGPSDTTISMDDPVLGYTPHTILSRLGDWQRRFGPRPGLMLTAALISRHIDEVLRLINHNPRVGAVWRRYGGPVLVRHLLYSHQTPATLLPATVKEFDIQRLIDRFLSILQRFGGEHLQEDIDYYRGFVQRWPGTDLGGLDADALRLARTS